MKRPILLATPILILFILVGFTTPLFTDVPDQDASKTVFLVRHAETCLEPARNPELTGFGVQRAEELVRLFSDVALDEIYSTPLLRTQATAAPIASQQGLDVILTTLESGFLERLSESIKASSAQTILVSGHSNTTPALVNMLAGTEYESLDETVFDKLFVVTMTHDGASVHILRYGLPSGTKEAC